MKFKKNSTKKVIAIWKTVLLYENEVGFDKSQFIKDPTTNAGVFNTVPNRKI